MVSVSPLRRQRLLLLLLLTLLAPADRLGAQAASAVALTPGLRVRVHALGLTPSPWTGRLAGSDSASLFLARDGDRAPIRLPRAQVARLEVSRGAPGRARRLLAFAMTGAALGALLAGPVAAGCDDCTGQAQRRIRLAHHASGALVGTVVGFAVGHLGAPPEQWQALPVP